MTKYSDIFIIYNPKSTGKSKVLAQNLHAELLKHKLKANLLATEYAGHARELASDIAGSCKQPLIVSSSGDGGYNEVINGVMSAGNSRVVCAVLPAGNANDHSHALQRRPLGGQIAGAAVKKIDLIRVTIASKDRKTVRYAHSYVGLGLTPAVAVELNKQSLNAMKELSIVVKTFMQSRSFQVKHGSETIRLDSLLFANINRMAKILTFAPDAQPDDGKFEVIQFPAVGKWQLVGRLMQAAIVHANTTSSASRYTFTVLEKMPMQLDGEVEQLESDSRVTIESVPRGLRTVY